MLSKTKISRKLKEKTNPALASAIFLAKKTGNIELASLLSIATRKQKKANLGALNQLKANEIIVPGKVLSSGNITRKIKIYALSFSKSAEEKIRKAGCEHELLIHVLKKLGKNEKLKGEILR